MKAVVALFTTSFFILVPNISNSYKIIPGTKNEDTIRNELDLSENCKEPPLHEAVRTRDPTKIKTLAQTRANLYTTDCNGLSPMHLAINMRDEEMMMALVRNRFDVNRRFDGGRTVLMHAAASGVQMAIDVLRGVGALLDTIDNQGSTALLDAAVAGKPDVVKRLVSLGANPNRRLPKGNTYLHIAATMDDFDMVRLFAEIGTSVDLMNDDGDTAVSIAVMNDNPAIINYLSFKGAKLSMTDGHGNTYLHYAVKENCAEAVYALVENGVSLLKANDKGETAFALSIDSRSTQMKDTLMDILIENNGNIDGLSNAGKSFLHEAVEKSSITAVEKLLNKGASVDILTSNDETPLTIAVKSNNLQLTEILISNKADLRKRTEKGKSYGRIAAMNKAWKSATGLVNHGYTDPTIDDRGHGRFNEMYYAVQSDDTEGVAVLADLGADVHQRYDNGVTLLHTAALFSSIESTKWLIDRGVNVNVLDEDSNTPLHCAVHVINMPEAELLIHRGACIECTNNEGRTPLDEAFYLGGTAFAEYLKSIITGT